jgi:sporulation protein YlmC with PRC-barrel domain
VELSRRSAISDLIGLTVYDQSGRRLGRVFELRGRWEGKDVVAEELMIGAGGLLKRLRGPGPGARGVPCEAIVEIGPERIVVRV